MLLLAADNGGYLSTCLRTSTRARVPVLGVCSSLCSIEPYCLLLGEGVVDTYHGDLADRI
jgi:hypothetical protein